ncbi:hypothetical protein BJF81_13440 [Ornithinimicrobium sp. CNJ-824]|uniref:hypothetical protein n=1 Tax=Ornithinimicrobium sp. CNJ-824 TaxID=1904966 RepID=UPI000967257D|nr:hypothetical protein [Ornithinimicrobium sp. CNJ-824]OLT22131.1 hypothetical protein BJF81_13440 [Ornithinimicrobium sp. CNJ-824]
MAAVYVVLSHPDPHELMLAMALASFFPEKHGISAVVGGLLGARHGSTLMLERGAARLELAWACDALGTDLAMTGLLTPLAKDPDGEPWLPSWGRDTAANGCDERRGGAPTRTRELPRRLMDVPTRR